MLIFDKLVYFRVRIVIYNNVGNILRGGTVSLLYSPQLTNK